MTHWGTVKKIVKIWDYRIGGSRKSWTSDKEVATILPHQFLKIGTPTPPVINDNPLGGWDGFLPFGGWGEFWGRGEFWGGWVSFGDWDVVWDEF